MGKKAKAVHTRWMIRVDLPRVAAVEAATGGTWTVAEFESCLRKRSMIGVVTTDGDEITGHLVYELKRESVEVHNLRAVEPAALVALAEKAVKKAAGHRRPLLVLPYRLARALAGAVLCCPDDPGLNRVYVGGVPVVRVCETARLLIACGADPEIVADAMQDDDCPDEGLLADLRAGGSLAALLARQLGESLDLVM